MADSVVTAMGGTASDLLVNGDMAGQPVANGNASLPTENGTSTTTAPRLSADEIALYDRQIRLWGAQAQERIRSANILLVSLRALGTEIAKNLTLAGISSLTIIDDEIVTEEDLGAQYFLREGDVGKSRAEAAIPRIQELNPRVSVKSGGSLANLLPQDQTYYAPFSCVIACDHDFNTLSSINTAARFASIPFYAASIHGFYGYIFADLVSHDFVVEREKSNIATAPGVETLTRSVLSVTNRKESSGKTIEIVKKREIYCPLILANSSPLSPDILSSRRKLKAVPALLPCLRALFDFERTYARLPTHQAQDLAIFTTLATTKSRELQLPPETLKSEFLRSFMQNLGAEIVPTAAFVGGRLSEDVINVLGMREQPIQNLGLFDGEGLDGRIYSLFSPPPELTLGMGAGLNGMNGLSNGVDTMAGLLDGAGMPANGMMGAAMEGNGMVGVTSAPMNGAEVVNLD
ncbi:E1 ubiquitin-activating protein aos1 [Recurvomyces mirabilis]|uniref:Ubiquitin-like 1-activating enzyme E1A n=1 Tax=Recurvomyces mirabilis TaxID=574656 RepID=A0AAE1BZW4_9PEZI|nr:E1 ubiquitin-activating protein aos1 [Recurvomyces mirabilis]KAK5151110.1 E1 ubiquitin-activating protein aos1 [Recurvomyces mirabilis]